MIIILAISLIINNQTDCRFQQVTKFLLNTIAKKKS